MKRIAALFSSHFLCFIEIETFSPDFPYLGQARIKGGGGARGGCSPGPHFPREPRSKRLAHSVLIGNVVSNILSEFHNFQFFSRSTNDRYFPEHIHCVQIICNYSNRKL